MWAEPIYVVALGASTPVGREAWSTAAAVRAGVSGFTEHPNVRDADGEPVRAAIAPWLDIELVGVERFMALLCPTIDQTLSNLHDIQSPSVRLAMAVALPEQHPGLENDLHDRLIDLLRAKYGPALSALATFPKGHAAGLLAVEAAANRLSEGRCDACVVAGVDSYIAPQTLEWLERCDQLHGAGPQNNAWGFVPGEGAGALLLARRSFVEQRQLPTMLRLVGVGTAFEPKRIKTDTVCIGEGLTQAFRGAIRTMADDAKITDVYCDMNGEPYRADEYGFTCLRTKEAFASPSDFVAPADCWGDVAAASGPLFACLAAVATANRYANGNWTLTWASSEGGDRAAALWEGGDVSAAGH